MHFIVVSSQQGDLGPVAGVRRESLPAPFFQPGYRSEFRFRSPSGRRLVDCYSYEAEFPEECAEVRTSGVRIFHGYLLGPEETSDLSPRSNYYGVYSHGVVGDEECEFGSDELGLSPLYHASADGYTFVANNPHLIAEYMDRLGLRVRPEPSLPLWHTMKITVESDNTGYEGIHRVRPWRYLSIGSQDEVRSPAKEKVALPESYDECVQLCVDELRAGMRSIVEKYSRLRSDLTGGYDSRLTFAFILDGGYQDRFTFHTGGVDENPDVVVATRLAEAYGLDHLRSLPRYVPVDFDLAAYDDAVRYRAVRNAMETSEVRMGGRWSKSAADYPENSSCSLNGKGAIFAKSYGVSGFEARMRRRFRGTEVDFANLTAEQLEWAPECFGWADSFRGLLTDRAFETSRAWRRYIVDFGYERFRERTGYADTLSAYQYRTHNANLDIMDANCIFLYSPLVLEVSRRLAPGLKQAGKLYFDIMYKLNPELCFFPYENRVYDPAIYADYPQDVRQRLAAVPPAVGSIESVSNRSAFEYLLPLLRDSLIDMLPGSVFDYVDRDAVAERLRDVEFGVRAYPLISLYGIAKWHDVVGERFGG
ncbi:hypothetical protein [Cellulosimicrobium sp. 4261]|uniref:hypothetical protein n=1 Tax=Cellulosimicrobium sp. 4261 TaxID=3156458 RepID=UPI00339A07C8